MNIKELTEIKSTLLSAIKYKDNVSIAVKVYEYVDLEDEPLFDGEIIYYLNEEYGDSYIFETFQEEQAAMIQAKSVLKTVKRWFSQDAEVLVEATVKTYS